MAMQRKIGAVFEAFVFEPEPNCREASETDGQGCETDRVGNEGVSTSRSLRRDSKAHGIPKKRNFSHRDQVLFIFEPELPLLARRYRGEFRRFGSWELNSDFCR